MVNILLLFLKIFVRPSLILIYMKFMCQLAALFSEWLMVNSVE